MKAFLFSFFLIFLNSASAQKMTREIMDAKDLEKIVLASDEIFRITIRAYTGKDVVITTRTEGEYYNEIGLESELQQKTLFLNSTYREILQSGYDKLSAHKIFSMEVELEIPIDMEVEIRSNLASVYLSGKYERVLVQLKSGSCYFDDFEGDAVVNTFNGNILGNAHHINAEAHSRHGEVQLPKINRGNSKMVLTSINGNIKLSESK